MDDNNQDEIRGRLMNEIELFLSQETNESDTKTSTKNSTVSTTDIMKKISEELDRQEDNNKSIVSNLIVDTLWFYGNQTHGDTNSEGSWTRLTQLVKDLVQAKIVPVSSMRLSLDISLLHSAGFSADETTITKILVRINTKILYRQQKYNLLREETEGFSKLAVTLQNIPYPPQDCSDYIKNIFSIIGQFDLDPNRVLDVILTAFEQQPKNLSFLKLISSYPESHIVHVLGHKFLFYSKDSNNPIIGNEESQPQQPPVQEEMTLPAPESLYAIAAALIGHQLVDMEALLVYMSPTADIVASESQIEDQVKVKEVLNYGVISLNAAKKETSTSTEPSDKSSSTSTSSIANTDTTAMDIVGSSSAYAHGYHSVGLATALLAIKCYDAAHPLLVDLDSKGVDIMRFDVLRRTIEDLLLWKISDVYKLISMKKYAFAKPSIQHDDMMTIASDNIIYFPHQDQKVQDMMSFTQASAPFIRLLGHRLCSNPILYTQLCRLIKHRLSELAHDLHHIDARIMIDLIGSVFLPSITAAEGSVFLVSQLWTAISSLSFSTRYMIYDIWYGSKTGKASLDIKHVDVVYSEAKALYHTKALLKRLAKENTKIIGRQLAKIAHYAPIVVFEYILNQIEYYDNLIPYVVEALKYTSDLAKDTLSYFFVIQLQRDDNKMRAGQTHFSNWYATLSKFIAHFYKRYPSTELRGMIHYLLQKLGDGECFDLLVLKNLLSIMGGCETMIEVSSSQLAGLAGGKILRSEIMGASVKEAVSKRAVRVLREELMSSNAAIPLLLFIAQIRSRIIYKTEARELKLISHLYDMAQDVLMQFTDFLIVGSKSVEMIVSLMPPLSELVGDIGLTLPVAFQLVRPILRAALVYGIDPSMCPDYLQSWHPFHHNIIDFVRNTLPDDIWNYISPQLYMMFWSLSVYDISLPIAAYSLETKRLKDRYADLDSKVYSIQATPTMSHADIEKANRTRKTDLTKILNTMKDLMAEQDAQKKHIESIKKIIISYKDTYFHCDNSVNLFKISEYIAQYCILERATLSPGDAVYCNQFFFMIHDLEVKYFSTLQYMDRIIKTITPLLYCTTESEASFLGFLINDVLTVATRWYDSKKLYEDEASSKLGFSLDIMKEISSSSLSSSSGDDDMNESDHHMMTSSSTSSPTIILRVSYEDYDRIFILWQVKLRMMFQYMFDSSEYMHLRSALVFLTHISSHFPTKLSLGNELIYDIEKLEKKEAKRPDLQVMAKSVWAMMKRQSASWKNDMVSSSSSSSSSSSNDAKATNRRSLASSSSQKDNHRLSYGSAGDGIEAGEEQESHDNKDMTSSSASTISAPADSSGRGMKRKAPSNDHRTTDGHHIDKSNGRVNVSSNQAKRPRANDTHAPPPSSIPPPPSSSSSHRGRGSVRQDQGSNNMNVHPADRMFNADMMPHQGSRRDYHDDYHNGRDYDDNRMSSKTSSVPPPPADMMNDKPSSRGRGGVSQGPRGGSRDRPVINTRNQDQRGVPPPPVNDYQRHDQGSMIPVPMQRPGYPNHRNAVPPSLPSPPPNMFPPADFDSRNDQRRSGHGGREGRRRG